MSRQHSDIMMLETPFHSRVAALNELNEWDVGRATLHRLPTLM